MITSTLMKHRKLIAAIVVIALIAIYFTSTTSNGWSEGAPSAVIRCDIKAYDKTLTGTANVGDSTVIGQMVPLTSFTSNIDTLDANTQYTISFGATMSTKTAKFGEALTNTISVTGKTGGSKANLNYLDSTGAASSSASVAGTAGGSSTLSIPGFVEHDYTPSAINIMGDVIDGSVFTFTITSTATDGRTSSTSATLTITVDSGGKIYLSVDNITVNLIDDIYYDGWNVYENAEYITVTKTDTYYSISLRRADTGSTLDSSQSTKTGMSDALTAYYSGGYMTLRQYNCGVAQLEALA